MIFKPGMKLRLFTYEIIQKNNKHLHTCVDPMIKHFGTIVTIKQESYNKKQVKIEGDTWYYHKDWFVPIKKLSFKNIQEL